MKQKLIISLIGLIACHLTAAAQVIFTEDPYIFLNMDLEAKENSALLTVETRSDRARMKSFPQIRDIQKVKREAFKPLFSLFISRLSFRR